MLEVLPDIVALFIVGLSWRQKYFVFYYFVVVAVLTEISQLGTLNIPISNPLMLGIHLEKRLSFIEIDSVIVCKFEICVDWVCSGSMNVMKASFGHSVKYLEKFAFLHCLFVLEEIMNGLVAILLVAYFFSPFFEFLHGFSLRAGKFSLQPITKMHFLFGCRKFCFCLSMLLEHLIN